MEGRDFELYNFCLFKTISLVNLKEALLARNVNFSPSDTYAMLTLRMRRAILENLDIQHSVIESIDLELEVFEKTKQRTGSGYDCSVPGCTLAAFGIGNMLLILILCITTRNPELCASFVMTVVEIFHQ